jgi:HSP20 family protein
MNDFDQGYPRTEISNLQTQINHLFDNFLNWSDFDRKQNPLCWMPDVDIYETESELVLLVDLPGLDPEKISVQVSDNVVTVQGTREMNHKLKIENFHRIERVYGSFSRSFTLPTSVDSDKVKITYRAGELAISLQKIKPVKAKRIPIAASAQA